MGSIVACVIGDRDFRSITHVATASGHSLRRDEDELERFTALTRDLADVGCMPETDAIETDFRACGTLVDRKVNARDGWALDGGRRRTRWGKFEVDELTREWRWVHAQFFE